MTSSRLLDGGMLNHMILYATAMMEMKSAMGLIVAAPTAGSCGTLPGTCVGAADFLGLEETEIVKGLLDAVGRRIPIELRCTALGGLAVARTSQEIEKRLKALRKGQAL